MIFRLFRIGVPIIAVSLLGGCADPGAGPSPSATVAAAQAPVLPPGSLDGTYEGTRTPEFRDPACGFVDNVGYDVSGTTIRLRTRKMRRALGGTIDATGHFSMTSTDGARQVIGAIRGNQLTATETTPPRHLRHSTDQPVPGNLCTAQITATRVSAGAAQQDAP